MVLVMIMTITMAVSMTIIMLKVVIMFMTTTMAASRTFHSFGVASTAVLRQFENASREKTEPIIVPHWSNGQSGTLKKVRFCIEGDFALIGEEHFVSGVMERVGRGCPPLPLGG